LAAIKIHKEMLVESAYKMWSFQLYDLPTGILKALCQGTSPKIYTRSLTSVK